MDVAWKEGKLDRERERESRRRESERDGGSAGFNVSGEEVWGQ